MCVLVTISKSFVYNGEEKLLLDVKIAAAIVGLLIFIVVLIVKLRQCGNNFICGSGIGDSDGGTGCQFNIQLPAVNIDDGSVLASAG